MSGKKAFDPFADAAPKAKGVGPVVDEPMDELFAVDGTEAAAEPADGWEPIEDETWDPQDSSPALDSLLLEESEPAAAELEADLDLDLTAPSHHNPLPGVTEAPSSIPTMVLSRTPEEMAPDSNEAILQSGRHRVDARERLPVRSDAPTMPVLQDTRPTAVVLPLVVAVAGIGAGVLICAQANPILGGIAIALSLVGSLFLRVMLKG